MSYKVAELVAKILGMESPGLEAQEEREQLQREIQEATYAARELKHTLANQTMQSVSLQRRIVGNFSDVEALLARRETR